MITRTNRVGIRLALAALTVPAAMLFPVAAHAQDASYVLGADDVIEVQVYGQNAQPIRLRVRSDGTIALPLIGTVAAAGQTPGQLAQVIERQYEAGGFFPNAIVNVEVVAYLSRSVTVLGAVRTPGIVPLARPATLTNIVAQAGGQVGSSPIAILRRRDGTEQQVVIAEVAGTAADPIVAPGDVVIVPQSQRFYVYGQVRDPGAFDIQPGMTFRQALAQAGGQNDAGTERSIRLYRAGTQTEIRELDAVIQPGDVLYIRERLL